MSDKNVDLLDPFSKIVAFGKSLNSDDHDAFYIQPNLLKFEDTAKITALDEIIDLSSSVYGPKGGLWAAVKGLSKVDPYDNSGKKLFKSKDGHEYLSTLVIAEKWVDAILTNVRGLTEYIAQFNDDTSRDGTTSLAMIASSIAKMHLMDRIVLTYKNKLTDLPEEVLINDLQCITTEEMTTYHDLINIPSTILNIVTKVCDSVVSKLINEKRVIVYDETARKYTENGKKRILSAINTTVDREPVIYEGFETLMDKCTKNEIDINTAFISEIENRSGAPRVDFNFISGIKMKARPIDTSIATPIKNSNTTFFILDGFISESNMFFFKNAMTTFLNGLFSLQDRATGHAVFDPIHKEEDFYKNPPVFFLTRTTEYMKEYFRGLKEDGFFVVHPTTKAKFRVNIESIYSPNDDYNEIHYKDICEVFKESFIDLNALEHYVNFRRDPSLFDAEKFIWKPTSEKELVDMRGLLPSISAAGVYTYHQYDIHNNAKVLEFPSGKLVLKDVTKSKENIKADIVMCMANITFNGSNVFIKPASKIISERAEVKKKLLDEQLRHFDENATIENMLEERANFFSGLTIKPIIYNRSESEGTNLKALFDDALGVFQSVHKMGVMPGSNVFMIKYSKVFKENVLNELDNIFNDNDYAAYKRDIYLRYAERFVDNIIAGYVYAYSFINDCSDKEQFMNYVKKLYNELNTDDKILTTFDVVTGNYTEEVIEAARTTLDVALAANLLAKDMLLLKRIMIYSSSDISSLNSANINGIHKLNIHPYLTQEEKYSMLKDVTVYKKEFIKEN